MRRKAESMKTTSLRLFARRLSAFAGKKALEDKERGWWKIETFISATTGAERYFEMTLRCRCTSSAKVCLFMCAPAPLLGQRRKLLFAHQRPQRQAEITFLQRADGVFADRCWSKGLFGNRRRTERLILSICYMKLSTSMKRRRQLRYGH